MASQNGISSNNLCLCLCLSLLPISYMEGHPTSRTKQHSFFFGSTHEEKQITNPIYSYCIMYMMERKKKKEEEEEEEEAKANLRFQKAKNLFTSSKQQHMDMELQL